MVPKDETLDQNPLAEDIRQILHEVLLLGRRVVRRDHAAHNDAPEPLHVVNGSLKVLRTDILVDNVQALGCEALECVGAALLVVVEAGVGAELLDDVLGFVVGADAANHVHALFLGELNDNLAHGAGGCVDPDSLAFLGLDKAVERVLGDLFVSGGDWCIGE